MEWPGRVFYSLLTAFSASVFLLVWHIIATVREEAAAKPASAATQATKPPIAIVEPPKPSRVPDVAEAQASNSSLSPGPAHSNAAPPQRTPVANPRLMTNPH